MARIIFQIIYILIFNLPNIYVVGLLGFGLDLEKDIKWFGPNPFADNVSYFVLLNLLLPLAYFGINFFIFERKASSARMLFAKYYGVYITGFLLLIFVQVPLLESYFKGRYNILGNDWRVPENIPFMFFYNVLMHSIASIWLYNYFYKKQSETQTNSDHTNLFSC
jgi:hypothetical protein